MNGGDRRKQEVKDLAAAIRRHKIRWVRAEKKLGLALANLRSEESKVKLAEDASTRLRAAVSEMLRESGCGCCRRGCVRCRAALDAMVCPACGSAGHFEKPCKGPGWGAWFNGPGAWNRAAVELLKKKDAPHADPDTSRWLILTDNPTHAHFFTKGQWPGDVSICGDAKITPAGFRKMGFDIDTPGVACPRCKSMNGDNHV